MSSTARQATTMLLGTLAATLLIVLGVQAQLANADVETATERLHAETDLVALWIEQAPADSQPQPLAIEIGRRLGLRVTFIDDEGMVLGDSARSPNSLQRMENHLERTELRDARRGSRGFSRRVSATTNVEYLYSARTVSGANAIRYVRLALPTSTLGPLGGTRTWLSVLLALAATVPLALAGLLAVRRLASPIDQLAEVVDRTASSELREPLPVPPAAGVEIERLGANINRLKLALLETLDALDAERTTLSSVVAGMREGLLLVGADRRIRLANQALREILDLDYDVDEQLLETVVRDPSVVNAIDRTLADGEEVQESVIHIAGSDRVFELHVTPLETARGDDRHDMLALFVDITRLDRLEKVRREFVANVSHELRTPLTSIKAFVENLIDGGLDEPETAHRFLAIVNRHADHMGELIEDLTDLSLIETGSIMLELRRVDATEVVREVVSNLAPQATAQDIELSIDLPDRLYLTSDRRRLEQMLTNLIGNAIKFNRERGQVTIGGSIANDAITLHVIDSGIGIPSTHLDKVFERFFQVNRDRSRAVGGTGLGLSIVKHLMRLHGGSVAVESELGRGSRFTLRFPPAEPRTRLVSVMGGLG